MNTSPRGLRLALAAIMSLVACSKNPESKQHTQPTCTAGLACSPAVADPCNRYATTCSDGMSTCNSVSAVPDGQSCGATSACKAGACVAIAGEGTVSVPGGEVVATDGTRVEVPADAVDGDTTIAVHATALAPPAGLSALGAVYEFLPSGVVFARPVKVTFPVPAGTTSASVYWERLDGTGYEPVGGAVDTVAQTITVETAHFSHAVVAQSSLVRTITGSALVTYVSRSERTTLPLTVDTPPKALVPDGNGYTTYEGAAGTGAAAGTFTIPNVPNGDYLLVHGSSFWVTASSAPSIGEKAGGRPPSEMTPTPPSTYLDLSVSGLAPWKADDWLILYCSETNLFDIVNYWASPRLATGDTSATLHINLGLSSPYLTESALGHQVYLLQMQWDLSSNDIPYRRVLRAATLPPFAFETGGTTHVSASIQDLTVNTIQVRVPFSTWRTTFGEAGNPTTQGTESFFGIYAQPGLAEDIQTPSTVDLLWYSDTLGVDLDSGFLNFGVPDWMGGFTLAAELAYGGSMTYQLPGTTAAATLWEGSYLIWDSTFSSVVSAAVPTPPLSLPRNIQVEGASFFQIPSGIGTVPLVTWAAPRVGVPGGYTLRVYEVYATAANKSAIRLNATLHTGHTSLRFPSGILTPGKHYVLWLQAEGGTFANASPAGAVAFTSSSMFTP